MHDRRFRVSEIFLAAAALPRGEQAAFVAGACGADAALRTEVENLLANDQDDSFLDPDGRGPGTQAGDGTGPASSLHEHRLRRLRARPPIPDRYSLRGEVARGGMGVILRAYDEDLGRTLAMKVVLGRGEPASGDTPAVDPAVLARFLDEAQITGQLDHPGVVPVHELGVHSDGRAWFTMRLVRGRTAEEVFALAREERDGWTLTKALEVILKICDTLAYAHEKGVLHRDLKPANVMVGRFGEVYVMDWGLAKVVGQADPRDLRIAPAIAPSAIRTDRARAAGSDSDSPLVTMDGAVVGTPSYMSPEQAQGRVEELDARSDVYAAGACLYTLLAGWQPYLQPGRRASPYAILQAVCDGPPKPVHAIDRSAPAELVAICEKAMARDKVMRYASMQELAEDLRAFLGTRVVRAHRTGAWAELRAWVRRNKALAMAIAVGVLSTVTALSVALLSESRARKRAADALAAGSLVLLDERAGALPDPAPGRVRFRMPENTSVFGGRLLEIHYAGPRETIEFALRFSKGGGVAPEPDRTLFEIPVTAFTKIMPEYERSGTRLAFILRLTSTKREKRLVQVSCFDPRLRARMDFTYDLTASDVDWVEGATLEDLINDYHEVSDDQTLVWTAGGELEGERSEIVVRFRD